LRRGHTPPAKAHNRPPLRPDEIFELYCPNRWDTARSESRCCVRAELDLPMSVTLLCSSLPFDSTSRLLSFRASHKA